jgi:hypothetical protein
MAVLTVNTVTRAGFNVEGSVLTAASSGGDSFPNTGREFVVFRNGDSSSKTVTLVFQTTVDGQSIANRTVSVPAGETFIFGPFPVNYYNDGNGRMNLTYSSVTSCSVGVFAISTS